MAICKGGLMKKILCLVVILATALFTLIGCTDTPSDFQGGTSANAPKIKIHLPVGASDLAVENEISVWLQESFTENSLTSSFAIISGDAVLVSVNGGSADSTIEWNDEHDVVLKVKHTDDAADSGKFKILVTSSWVEINDVSDDSLTLSVTKDIFYATKNGKVAYSLESETDALEKLN